MDDFNDMFGKAARLKSEQLKAQRPNFERSPDFYKHSLYLDRELADQRALPIDHLLDAACALKDTGNTKYSRGAHSEAYHAYERALGCVRYFHPIDPDWRKSGGFSDETLREVFVQDKCDTPEREQRLRELLLACYLNIAQVRLADKSNYPEAIAACNEAIALDPQSAKAYFRRARARYEPLSCTATDQELAVKDLAVAAKLMPDDQHIRRELHRLRAEDRKQRLKDRSTFDGMFERGPALYDPEEVRKYAARKQQEEAEAERANSKAGMERVYDMVARHDAAGEHAEADKLRAEIARAREKAAQKAREERLRELDYSNPTEAMIADAAKAGIDLNDPQVRECFKQLAAEELAGGKSLANPTAKPSRAGLPFWKAFLIGLSIVLLFMQVAGLVNALRAGPRSGFAPSAVGRHGEL